MFSRVVDAFYVPTLSARYTVTTLQHTSTRPPKFGDRCRVLFALDSEENQSGRKRQSEEAQIVWAEIRRLEQSIRKRTERLRTLRVAKEALEAVTRPRQLTTIGRD